MPNVRNLKMIIYFSIKYQTLKLNTPSFQVPRPLSTQASAIAFAFAFPPFSPFNATFCSLSKAF